MQQWNFPQNRLKINYYVVSQNENFAQAVSLNTANT